MIVTGGDHVAATGIGDALGPEKDVGQETGTVNAGEGKKK